MSFDITPTNRNLSNVQASSKTTDGGAGNTGYFRRNQSEQEEEIQLSFKNTDIYDSFEKQEIETEEEYGIIAYIKTIILKIIDTVEGWFFKENLY